MTFENQVALITGAAVGIGRATALELARMGADLILLDIDLEKLAALKQELAQYTDRVWIYACDISDENTVNETVTNALAQTKKIDILVNNAAIWRTARSFLEIPTENVIIAKQWSEFVTVIAVIFLEYLV